VRLRVSRPPPRYPSDLTYQQRKLLEPEVRALMAEHVEIPLADHPVQLRLSRYRCQLVVLVGHGPAELTLGGQVRSLAVEVAALGQCGRAALR